MKRIEIKKAAFVLSLVLLGFIMASIPSLINRFKVYGLRAKTAEAKILIECAYKHPECIPIGETKVMALSSLCPKVTCFEFSTHYYKTLQKMQMTDTEQLLVVWGTLGKQDSLNLDLWAKINDAPAVQCIDGTGWQSDRTSKERPCNFLKLNPTIDIR